jgi:hypothetical protein
MAKEARSGVNQGNVGEHSLSGYGPIGSVKRRVRTPMLCVVGSGGTPVEKSPFGNRRMPLSNLTDLEINKSVINFIEGQD